MNLLFIVRIALLLTFCVTSMRGAISGIELMLMDSPASIAAAVTVEASESCSADGLGAGCCCGGQVSRQSDCCCAAPVLQGDAVVDNVSAVDSGKFYDAFITAVQCSDSADYFTVTSLTDYMPVSIDGVTGSLDLLSFAVSFRESSSLGRHLPLPFRPPISIS